MMSETGFNLLDEPWIVALGPNGQECELSILDVFAQAPRLVTFGGEVPTQGFAITRLLLAFLHRAIDGPADQDEWADLWNAPELPMDRIRDYADRVRHRFDLFDTKAPFFQVSDLRTAKGTMSGLKKIVADYPDREPHFTTRSATSLSSISSAEAARWLVHVHAFDPRGIKTGAVGDLKMQEGKGFGSSIGWSGQIGGVLPEGRDLRETLILNLVARDVPSYVRIGDRDDVPPWERPVDDAMWDDKRPVHGAIDLYTWQTRRVRLAGGRSGVVDALVAKGDTIEPQNLHGVDPHTAWQYREPASKKLGVGEYRPVAHNPDRRVWAGLEALLPSVHGQRSRSGGPERYRPPGVMQWICELVQERHLPADLVIRTRVVGAQYHPRKDKTSYGEVVHDRLPLAVAVLREDDPALGQTAVNAVGDAEQTAGAVWRFAENLAQAAGAEPKSGAGDQAREQLYAGLDQPYRRWLAGLGIGIDPVAVRAEWQGTVQAVCRPVVDELLQAAGPAAWVGRTVNNRLVNVALAEAWFNAALRKALPHAFPHTNEPTKEVA
jgi:CRISPR system Cascade subunit CasA